MAQPKQPGQETTNDMMKGYIDNLDALTQKTTGNVLPTEQALLDARKVIDPQQHQLELELAQKYLPQFTKLGLEQQEQEAMGRAGADTRLLQGPGKELVAANLEAQKIADPEFYRTRAAAEGQIQRLMASLQDPDSGLSPTERAEIERSQARTNQQRGNETPTGTSAVEAAMEFGKAGQDRRSSKQQAINAAIQTATQAMPTMKSGVDVLQLTTGRPSSPNMGLMKMGDPREVGATSMGLGQQLMSQVGDNQRQTSQINSQKRTAFDTVMKSMDTASKMSSMMTGI